MRGRVLFGVLGLLGVAACGDAVTDTPPAGAGGASSSTTTGSTTTTTTTGSSTSSSSSSSTTTTTGTTTTGSEGHGGSGGGGGSGGDGGSGGHGGSGAGGSGGAGGDPSCLDDGLALDDASALSAARAIGLCKDLVSATWVLPDGSPPPADPAESAAFHLGHGLLAGFGPNLHPQQGSRMLALSTGTARAPGDPGFAAELDKGYASAPIAGIPDTRVACPGVTMGAPHDGIALELRVTTPVGEAGLMYSWAYFTRDWPAAVCAPDADVFLGLLLPPPPVFPDGDITSDDLGDFVTGASSFLDACGCKAGPPCLAGPPAEPLSFPCSLGTKRLAGTGFDGDAGDPTGHGSTGWMSTHLNVKAGETVTLRFAVYDSGTGLGDSTVLVDDFRWYHPGVGIVGSGPIAKPK